MPDPNDNVPVTDRVEIQHTQQAVFNPNLVKVKVLAESGIFKNGRKYEQGDEAVISRDSALNFQQIGEVEILEAPDANPQDL